MLQRRSHRTAPRSRTLALGGALAALAVVGGGTVAAVHAPSVLDADDIQLTQNAGTPAGAQELPVGTEVNLDLEPVVAQAAGGTVPEGTTVQVTGLPDGLTQDGWVISGTPTRAGEYEVLVTVSALGVSRSEKVAITVTDGAGEQGDGATTTSPATTATTAPSEPTLSAVPGDPTLEDDGLGGDELDGTDAGDGTDDGSSGTGEDGTGEDGTGDGDEAGATPDLCAVLGDGQSDGASLTQLLPLVTGGAEDASSGLVMVLLDTVVNLLPSVLGESGSLEGLGSAGELLCTLPPSLLGGLTGGAGATGGGTGGAATTAGATTGGTGNAAGDALATAGGPAALLGLLTTGAGSLGQ